MQDTILRYVQAALLAILAIIASVRNPGVVPLPPPTVPPIQQPQPQPPQPIPVPQPPVAVQPNAKAAIARAVFGSASCTCTFIGPRRNDGCMDILCAAHCISNRGNSGIVVTQTGERVPVTRTAIDIRADLLWLKTNSPMDHPFALLADVDAPAGKAVWHEGYGVHIPRNRENGTIVNGPNADGQMMLRISVSSGDSGAALFGADDDRVYAVVCCGNARWVWGGAASRARAIRP